MAPPSMNAFVISRIGGAAAPGAAGAPAPPPRCPPPRCAATTPTIKDARQRAVATRENRISCLLFDGILSRISSDHPRDDVRGPRLAAERVKRRIEHDKREFPRVLQGGQCLLDV